MCVLETYCSKMISLALTNNLISCKAGLAPKVLTSQVTRAGGWKYKIRYYCNRVSVM